MTVDLVNRPRLLNHLDNVLNRQLTLISAPAGFGKTTLLYQWLVAAPIKWAWLSLDSNDNELPTFLNYVIAAIQTVFPQACLATQGLLSSVQLPPVDYLLKSLVNDLAEAPDSFVLIMDDYQNIQTSAIDQLLVKLLDHLPPTLHLVLISRVDPPFSLSRLRSRGQLNEIRSAALRFSTVETSEFLSLTATSPLSPAAVATLERRTEGWIAGLRLAAISLQNHPNPDAFLSDFNRSLHRPVMEYLLDEVLSQQTEEVQEFLIRTSVLNRFCASLCQAVLAEDESSRPHWADLDWLAQVNPFLTRLDEAGEWYRYHHLFQELLNHRLKVRQAPAEIDDLHRRAARWFAAHGYIDDALHHYLAGDDALAAGRLVEQNYHPAINREDWPVVRHWLNQLPPNIIEQHPGLLLANCWPLHHEYRLAAISPLLDKAEQLLETSGHDMPEADIYRLLGEINTLRAEILYFQGKNEVAHALAEHALEQLPPDAVFTRSLALLFLGATLQALGHTRQALQLLQTAIDAEVSHNTITLRAMLMMVFVHQQSADLSKLHQTGQIFLQTAQKIGWPLSIAWANYHLGLLFYEWNQLEAAEQHLLVAANLRYHAHALVYRDSLMGLALVYLARNNCDELEQMLDELETFVRETGSVIFRNTYHSFVAGIRLRQNDPEAAGFELQKVAGDGQNEPMSFLEHSAITRCRILINFGQPSGLAEAALLLDRWQAVAEANHDTLRQIQISALRALLCRANGQPDKALTHLARAVQLAQPGQLIRTFVDLGQPLAGLLRQLPSSNSSLDYTRRILAAFGDAPQPPVPSPPESPLVEPLTYREIEVLELLQQRLSNQEIAARLVITPATVKRHTSNIYQKLSVNSRRQAVTRALSLGILAAPESPRTR